jgi:hypothetical protein
MSNIHRAEIAIFLKFRWGLALSLPLLLIIFIISSERRRSRLRVESGIE